VVNDRIVEKVKNTANLQLVKETNMTLIFNLIYQLRPVSRIELAKKTKLSPTTVSSLVDELLQRKMVMESGVGETGTSGRKPIMLDIDAKGGFVVSIEMVKNGFHCSLYDLLCMQVDKGTYTVDNFAGIGEKLIEAVFNILKINNLSQDRLKGITIGAPGLIDYQNSRIIFSTVVPIDANDDLVIQLRGKFPDIPVVLENISCFCVYAEKKYGSKNSAQNLVFVDVNIGIGAGILVNGEIYRGSSGLAGEIGHISIDMNGPKCKCGNRGCLEVMASIPAMFQKIIFAILSGRDTAVKEMINNDFNRINIEIIKQAIDMRDEVALEVVDDIALRLAFGINNIINLFNPEVVVIGGEIMRLGIGFLEKVKANLSKIGLKPNVEKVEVRYSMLESDIAMIGGARYMLDHIFHAPGLLVDLI
jgi:N-acetylglucosamine repressor